MAFSKVGPNQSIEWGQSRVSKSAMLHPVIQLLSKPFKIDRFREASFATGLKDLCLVRH